MDATESASPTSPAAVFLPVAAAEAKTVGGIVLNVNDDEASRYVTSAILTRGGHRVVEAENGEEALQKLRTHAPDVVILDVGLPDLNGFEVCRRMRAASAASDAPPTKILCTSAMHVTIERKVQGLEVGADGYLFQPFEVQELLATVQSLVRLGRAERELRARADHLAAADRRKTELLALLAHELRNPLAAIAASLPLLERQQARDEIEQRAREVTQRQLRHLTRLVDDLLDVSRVTQGKIDLQCEPLDIGALAMRAASTARDRLFVPRGQRLHVAAVESAAPLRMIGDATRLEQVMTNLLDNASKFTGDGGEIFVHVDVGEDGARGRAAIITVRDTGIGVHPEHLESIFAPFEQESVGRSRGGLGIGLALVRSIVELHGGSVTAASEGVGRGTVLRVELPLTAAPAAAAAEPLSSSSSSSSSASSPPSSSPAPASTARRLLIVEDNEDAQWALRDLCEMWGHEVHVASDGPSGVAVALEAKPDIALVDIGLPVLDGYEVARRIRAGGHPLLLVALTGYGSPEQKEQALRSGFDMHLVKPVSVEALEVLLTGGTAGAAPVDS